MYKCKEIMKIVFGLLLLLNALIWPQWSTLTGWIAWISILMVVFAVVKMLMPQCKGCENGSCTCTKEKIAKKKRK